MVEVRYIGRLGNQLFQYCFGRILSEGLGFCLAARPLTGFPNTATVVAGLDYSGPKYPSELIRYQRIDLESFLAQPWPRRIALRGYFQRYEYYKHYKDVIRSNWLRTDEVGHDPDIMPDDIVLHIRRGDYVAMRQALSLAYYEDALSRTTYDRMFICTDDPQDPFLASFLRRGAIIHHTPEDPSQDLRFIMKFNKIVQSASSFSWWASFLSNAQEIYCPIPASGYWAHPNVALTVDDEERYTYIECKRQ